MLRAGPLPAHAPEGTSYALWGGHGSESRYGTGMDHRVAHHADAPTRPSVATRITNGARVVDERKSQTALDQRLPLAPVTASGCSSRPCPSTHPSALMLSTHSPAAPQAQRLKDSTLLKKEGSEFGPGGWET